MKNIFFILFLFFVNATVSAQVPTIIEPTNGAVLDNGCTNGTDGTTWTFKWTEVPNADSYQLYIGYALFDDYFLNGKEVFGSSHDLIINSAVVEQDFYVKIRAKFSDGTFSEWSAPVYFTDEPANTDCQCIQPSILANPQTTQVCINQRATFTASANVDGSTPMTIKWQRNGVDITTSSPCIPGLTMAFTTSVLNNNDNDSYYQAVFSNECGSITSDIAYIKIDLYAKGGQAVLSNDINALNSVICPNETKSLTTINSVGTIIRWQISKDNVVWSDIPNSNVALLVLNGIKSNLNVWYRAILQSTYGVCTPPNTPVYSSSFQVKFKKTCIGNSNFADNSSSNIEFSAKAYPSNIIDDFTIETQAITEGGIEIQFYNLSGAIVRTLKREISVGFNQIPLNINDFVNGSYFIKIKADDGNQAVIKINKIE